MSDRNFNIIGWTCVVVGIIAMAALIYSINKTQQRREAQMIRCHKAGGEYLTNAGTGYACIDRRTVIQTDED